MVLSAASSTDIEEAAEPPELWAAADQLLRFAAAMADEESPPAGLAERAVRFCEQTESPD